MCVVYRKCDCLFYVRYMKATILMVPMGKLFFVYSFLGTSVEMIYGDSERMRVLYMCACWSHMTLMVLYYDELMLAFMHVE